MKKATWWRVECVIGEHAWFCFHQVYPDEECHEPGDSPRVYPNGTLASDYYPDEGTCIMMCDVLNARDHPRKFKRAA